MVLRRGAARLSLAIIVGALAWHSWHAVAPSAAGWLRFIVGWAFLVVGPGLAAALPVVRFADSLERWILAFGAGLLASPLLAHALGRLGVQWLFPYAAAGFGAAALDRIIARREAATVAGTRAVVGCTVAAAIALAAGTVAYAHRIDVTPQGITVFGDYDTFDSTYYAAMSSELAHRVPPESPFRAGHPLNYSYYPQLLLAMLHRFGGVPLLDEYFIYAWPAFLITLAVMGFITVRRLTNSGTALLATVLLLLGSDLSYLAAVFFRRYRYWDDLVWSTNWMTPGAELLHYNPWTPALVVLFLALWALKRHEECGATRLLLASALCVAELMAFKPFAFAVVSGGLFAAALFSGGDRLARRRFLIVGGAGVVLGVPWIVTALRLYADSQSSLELGSGYATVLPTIVTGQLGLGPLFHRVVNALGGGTLVAAVVPVVIANLLFFTGGLGVRVAGLPDVWRALRHGHVEQPMWRLLAWIIVTGALTPFAIVTRPYHQTFMFYQASLFLLWIFVARATLGDAPRFAWRQISAAALVVLLATPSTLHYLHEKWVDFGHQFAVLDPDAQTIAAALAQEDREKTVVLHRFPAGPSFFSVLSERRVVLAWAPYARDSAALQREIEDFFVSADGDPERAWLTLTRNHVTHVIQNEIDRIHPSILRRLRPILVTRGDTLYVVADVPHSPAAETSR